MARTLNAAVYTIRRDSFVDAAQRLIQTRGYERMSIQDVLDELDASRGAFYHYFDSKQALLEAVIDRLTEGALAMLAPMVIDPNLSAVQKLEGVFAGIARWKAERRELVLAIIEVWVSDENAIVREKFRHRTVKRLVPVLSTIIEQGVEEGVFTTGSPEHTANAVLALIMGSNDLALELFMARQANTVEFETVERSFAAYTEAMERILGLTAGTLKLIDAPTLHLWFG